MYSKIKCPYTKKLTKISSKKGKEILLNYIKFTYGGAPKLNLNGICSLENMLEANRIFFENQIKIIRFIQSDKKRHINIQRETQEVLDFYPGNNEKYWRRCSNPGDGHCFYWALYRTLLALNKAEQLPKEVKSLNLHHLNNPMTDYKDQLLDIGILRHAAYKIASKRDKSFSEVNQSDLEIMKRGYISALNQRPTGSDGWATDWDMLASAIACGICIAVFQVNLNRWIVYNPQENIEDSSCNQYMCFCINNNRDHFDSLIPVANDDGIPYEHDLCLNENILDYIQNNSIVLAGLNPSESRKIAGSTLDLVQDDKNTTAQIKDNAIMILNILNNYINHDIYGLSLQKMHVNATDRLIDLIHLINFYISMGRLNTPPHPGITSISGRKKPIYKKTNKFLIDSPLKWKSLDDMIQAMEIFKKKIIEDIKKDLLNIPSFESLSEYIIAELGLPLSILFPSSSVASSSKLPAASSSKPLSSSSSSSKPDISEDQDIDADLKAAIAASLIEESKPASTQTIPPSSSSLKPDISKDQDIDADLKAAIAASLIEESKPTSTQTIPSSSVSVSSSKPDISEDQDIDAELKAAIAASLIEQHKSISTHTILPSSQTKPPSSQTKPPSSQTKPPSSQTKPKTMDEMCLNTKGDMYKKGNCVNWGNKKYSKGCYWRDVPPPPGCYVNK